MQLIGVVKRQFNQGTRAQYERNSQGQTLEIFSLNVIFQTLRYSFSAENSHAEKMYLLAHIVQMSIVLVS